MAKKIPMTVYLDEHDYAKMRAIVEFVGKSGGKATITEAVTRSLRLTHRVTAGHRPNEMLKIDILKTDADRVFGPRG